MMGFIGSNRQRSFWFGSPMYSFMNSSSGNFMFSIVCVVRKPSCTFMNGVSTASAARRAMSARSQASCALRPNKIPQPQSATLITSSWPQWTLSECEVKRARADVENDGQPLAGNRVEHFLHQHEALAAGEIRHASAREREAFARRGGGMFGLRLDERERVAPEILFAVGDFGFVTRAHRRRGRDRVRARAVSDVGFDPHDARRAIRCAGNSGVSEVRRLVAHRIK